MGRRILCAAILCCGVLVATPLFAQTRDDFDYWDANGNGDLTCSEAAGRDEGLKLPAYRDNRDGTGIIYNWLQRSRSSDTDGDGVACESSPNSSGYIPNAQPPPPPPPPPGDACPANAETWSGLKVCPEQPRAGYDRDAFGTGYSSLEDDIIAALPPTMKANGQVYTPYSCIAFEITASGTSATDIDHIVALAEAHDSGIADDRRRAFGGDIDNLTIADPTVNRSQKSDRDAAEWQPARHGAWFANRVIQVKREYGLSVDLAERAALEVLLTGGGAQLSCTSAPPPPPPPPLPPPPPPPNWTHVRTVSGRLEAFEREDVAVRLSISRHRERVFQYRFRVEHAPASPFLKTIVRNSDGDVATSEGRDGWVETSIGVPTRRRTNYQFVLTRVASRNRKAVDYDITIERREVEKPGASSPPPPPPNWTHVRTVSGRLEAFEREDVAVRLSISRHRERVFQYRFRVEHAPASPFLKTIVRNSDGDVATSEGRDGWVETSIGVPTRRRTNYQLVLTRVASRNRKAVDYDITIERREFEKPGASSPQRASHRPRQ